MRRNEYRKVVMTAGDRLHSFAAWMLRDREEARDVTQEAFLRLWEHRERVRPASARSWLLRTSHRLCMDRIRKRILRNERRFDEGFEPHCALVAEFRFGELGRSELQPAI